MEFTSQFILLSGILLTLSVLASVVANRSGVPLLLLFLVLGMIAGAEGPGGIRFTDIQSAHLLATLALAIILFDGGLHTPLRTFRVGWKPGLALATVGVVITAGVTAAFVMTAFDLPWAQALLMAAVVASTDAAAVFYLLRSKGLQLQERGRATLEVESGVNDPMAVFLTVAMIEVLLAPEARLGWDALIAFVQQMGLGTVIGLGAGAGLALLIDRVRLPESLYPLLALSGGLLTFGAASVIGGSGFLAAYVGGLTVGARARTARLAIRRFHDGVAWLCQIGLFLMLGLLVTPSQLLPTIPQALLVVAGLTLVARPASVFISLLPFRFPWREQVFLSWVGLRGAVPIVLSLYPLLAGVAEAATVFNIAFFVVLMSLLVQGWTVAPLARWLSLALPGQRQHTPKVEMEAPDGQDLLIYHLPADCPAAGQPVSAIPLPEDADVMAVVRDRHPLAIEPPPKLLDGDYLYILARHAGEADLALLDQWLTSQDADALMREHEYFGEFVVNAEAEIAELAPVYGIDPPRDMVQGESVGRYLHRRLKRRPTPGDRVVIGKMELVVRETENDRITRVGLKLRRQRKA
ncbi:potassium/proton antiporter [Ectothiorhodospiraceae bacterium WFHF3C12]|nr:potassium/proton antiporter [Ectothiorhodospiraceae bacterium WFHF3C12]